MTGRVASLVSVGALVLLGGGAATASALTATPGGPLIHVSVPRGWKPVSYGGLTIDVPGSWSVSNRSQVDCGITGPGVLVGPANPYAASIPCPYFPPRGPIIIFGGPDTVFPVGQERSTLINGIEALGSKSTMQAGTLNDIPVYTTEEVVRFPGETVWLDIRVPGRASAPSWTLINKVLETLRSSLAPVRRE